MKLKCLHFLELISKSQKLIASRIPADAGMVRIINFAIVLNNLGHSVAILPAYFAGRLTKVIFMAITKGTIVASRLHMIPYEALSIYDVAVEPMVVISVPFSLMRSSLMKSSVEDQFILHFCLYRGCVCIWFLWRL